ncbi:MAG: MBL fold metallo-hydrolase [Phycisphaerae bacterium]
MSQNDLRIQAFVDPNFAENAYVVSVPSDDGNRVGWVIDPSFAPAVDNLVQHAITEHITVEKILLTHGHGDHIAGIDKVRRVFPAAQVGIHPSDRPMLADGRRNLSAMFGIDLSVETPADLDLIVGMSLLLRGLSWQVLDTSGHSPGGVSFYCAQAGVVFTGDALFPGSIGRTDFPGSNGRQLLANIRRNLLTLPDETVVYAGHGPPTTIGIERKSNPFLAE